MQIQTIQTLQEISAAYDVILCDVWGVLHNGVAAFPAAAAALKQDRQAGLSIVLITNSPRPAPDVITQLRALGVPDDAWDAIVTSGDVTRGLIAEAPPKVFHLGPDRDAGLFSGLDVELVTENDAHAVACTGLFDDETETPEDYADMLARMQARGLPFVCANPDIVVERGDRLVYCAGALAREYAELGGTTLIAGKPHKPIYDRAFAMAAELRGEPANPERTLVIGDGIATDVKGAIDAGLDFVFISDGIHAREYGQPGAPDMARMAAFLDEFAAEPVATMKRLA